MNTSTIFGQSTQSSMILGQSHLRPKNSNIKKRVNALMITSLVDAFSILVIYLLFGPSINGENVTPDIGVKLPVAYQSQLTDQETSLTLKNNRYYLKNHEISASQLGPELKRLSSTLNKESGKALVIIADQKNDIEKLNPILIAASEAGLSELRLAVEHKGE